MGRIGGRVYLSIPPILTDASLLFQIYSTLFCGATNRYCGRIQQGAKPKQRFVRLHVGNVSQELQKFERKEYPFGATAGFNDIWLELDLRNEQLELAVVQKIY